MKVTSRMVREIIFFVAVTAAALVVLPLVAAALAYQSRQAMFWPAYQSLYTYFLSYSILASVLVAGMSVVVRGLVRRIRRKRAPNSG